METGGVSRDLIKEDKPLAEKYFLRGIPWMHAASYLGDPYASLCLGVYYKYGFGGLQNDEKLATEYFEQAANSGIAGGQFCFGLSCYNGLGITRDMEKAKDNMNKAADQGNQCAISCLKDYSW